MPVSSVRSTPERGLSPKHELFVLEYIKDWDATRAATVVGYKHPTVEASKLLNPTKYPQIYLAIEEHRKQMRLEAEIDAKAVVKELVRLATLNPKRLFKIDGTLLNIHEIPDEVAVCIREFRVQTKTIESEDGSEPTVTITTAEVRFWDKLDALRQLGQHLGLLKETVNNTTNINQLVISWDEMYKRQGSIGGPGAGVVDHVQERLNSEQQKLVGIQLELSQVVTLPPVNSNGPNVNTGSNGNGNGVHGGGSNGNGNGKHH